MNDMKRSCTLPKRPSLTAGSAEASALSPVRPSLSIPPFLPLCLFILTASLLMQAAMPEGSEARNSFYSLQVAAFQERQQAAARVAELGKKARDVFYRQEEVEGKGRWFRVYIGKYRSKDEAGTEARRLKQLGVISGYMIRLLDSESAERTPSVPIKEEPKPKEEPPPSKEEPRKAQEQVARPEASLIIKEVSFSAGEDGVESVSFEGSQAFTPQVQAMVGERAKLSVDIKDIASFRNAFTSRPVNGRLIRVIRAYYSRESRTLRVVLELDPSKNYSVDQTFYEGHNTFVVEVQAEEDLKKGEPASKIDR